MNLIIHTEVGKERWELCSIEAVDDRWYITAQKLHNPNSTPRSTAMPLLTTANGKTFSKALTRLREKVLNKDYL